MITTSETILQNQVFWNGRLAYSLQRITTVDVNNNGRRNAKRLRGSFRRWCPREGSLGKLVLAGSLAEP
jgi:hypothetical protein